MALTRRIRGGSKKPRSSAKRSYRKRVKESRCRKIKRSAVCKRTPGCKHAKGRKRSFCRKSRNTKRRGRKSSSSTRKHRK